MNIKQQKFVLEYLKTFNATHSAIIAGYSKKTAYSQGQRLLKNVEIKELLEKNKKQLIDNGNLDIQHLQSEIINIAQNSNSEHVKLRAYDMLAKMIGAYKEKVEHSGDFQFQFINNIPD